MQERHPIVGFNHKGTETPSSERAAITSSIQRQALCLRVSVVIRSGLWPAFAFFLLFCGKPAFENVFAAPKDGVPNPQLAHLLPAPRPAE